MYYADIDIPPYTQFNLTWHYDDNTSYTDIWTWGGQNPGPMWTSGINGYLNGPKVTNITATTNCTGNYSIKVSSSNSPTGSAPKYSDSPGTGNATSLFSVWPGESFTVKVTYPDSAQLPPNHIVWNVAGTSIPNNTKSYTFSWPSPGTKLITVQVGQNTYNVWADVPNVGSVSQATAAATLPPYVVGEIGAWSAYALNYTNSNYPVGPKRDAMRHSLWCGLSISNSYVSQSQMLYFSTAHEYTNKNTDGQQAFNSTMDLWNNMVGSGVVISHSTIPPTANVSAIIQDLENKYSNGELWVWAGNSSETASEGIIVKSNGLSIH